MSCVKSAPTEYTSALPYLYVQVKQILCLAPNTDNTFTAKCPQYFVASTLYVPCPGLYYISHHSCTLSPPPAPKPTVNLTHCKHCSCLLRWFRPLLNTFAFWSFQDSEVTKPTTLFKDDILFHNHKAQAIEYFRSRKKYTVISWANSEKALKINHAVLLKKCHCLIWR